MVVSVKYLGKEGKLQLAEKFVKYRWDWLLVMFILLKGIFSLRIFDEMRNLLIMVKTTIEKIVAFAVITGVAVVMFTVMHYAVIRDQIERNRGEPLDDGEPQILEFSNILGGQYQTIFGENPELKMEEKYTEVFVLYLLFTLIVNIVLLNLLISIIGDNYDRVLTTYKSTDLKEKSHLLLETGFVEFLVIGCGRGCLRRCSSRLRNQNEYMQNLNESLPKQSRRELYHVHRFIYEADLDDGETDAAWVGSIKTLQDK
jgi:hypothetical protein